MKKLLKRIINKIFRTIGLINKNDFINYIEENEKRLSLLEYKLWEDKVSSNILLYESNLAKGKKKRNYNPLVSIIIPVYNGSNYLNQAIEAALNQTYKNIEIIVINDGSTDDGKSETIAKKHKDKIKYYSKKNGGVSSALNYGIKKMNGEYFAWLSHDDLIEPNHIEKLVEYVSIEGHEKHIPYAAFKIIDEKSILRIKATIEAQINLFDYKLSTINNDYTLLKGEINGGSVLIPKKAFDKHGLFNESERITQERDMWSRLIKEYKFISIPYTTAMIRTHSKQVTNTNKNVIEETNKKNLEILANISDERINDLGLDKISFYKSMQYHHHLHTNKTMVKEIEELINEIEKETDN